MRPDKLGFEDCDKEAIFRVISAGINANDSDTKKSPESSVKPNKLPLPRHLKPNPGDTVKVYSYCKIIDKTDEDGERVIEESESCQEFKIPPLDNSKKKQGDSEKPASKSDFGTQPDSRSKTIKAKHRSDANNKNSSPINKSCNTNPCEDKSNQLDKDTLCKYKCLKEECEKELNKKKLKSEKQTEDIKAGPELHDDRNNPCSSHKDKLGVVKDGQQYPALEINKSSSDSTITNQDNLDSSKKESDPHTDISEKRSRLKEECDKILNIKRDLEKRCRSQSCSNEPLKSCLPSCKGTCQTKSIKKESEKRLDENQNQSDSSLASSCPKRKQSFQDFCKEQADCKNKKKSKCKGICNNQEGDKHLEKEKTTRPLETKSSLDDCPVLKPSARREGSNKYLRKKSNKYFEKKYSETLSGDKSTSYAICTKTETFWKDVCKIFSDQDLRKKCEEYLDKKYSKKHSDNSSVDEKEVDSKTQKGGKPASQLSQNKNIKSDKDLPKPPGVCKESNVCPEQINSDIDLPKKSTSDKWADVCKEIEACMQHKKNQKDNISHQEKAKQNKEKKVKRSKLSSRDQCKSSSSKKSKSDTETSTSGSENKPIVLSKHSKSETESSLTGSEDKSRASNEYSKSDILENSTTGSEDKQSAKSVDKKNPSQLCIYLCPCKSGEISIVKKDCPVSSKQANIPSAYTPKNSLNTPDPGVKEDTLWNKYFSKPLGTINKDKEEGSLWSKYFSSPPDTNKPESDPKIPILPKIFKTSYKMDSEQTSKICFTNPQSKKRPISSDFSSLKSNDEKGKASLDTISMDSKTKNSDSEDLSKIGPNEEWKKLLEDVEKNESVKEHSISDILPQNDSLSETEKPTKSLVDAHRETMFTIKYAMQDIVSKAYKTTSEAADAAATLFHDESTKQMEKFKSYRNRQDDSEYNDNTLAKNPTNSGNPKQLDHTFEDDDVPVTQKILDEVASKVSSAVSFVNKNVDTSKIKVPSFNDASSVYDKPTSSNVSTPPSPKPIGNIFPNDSSTSTNSMFKTIKSKILSIFSGVDDVKKDSDSSPPSTETSDASILTNAVDTEEEVIDKLSE